MKRLSLFVLFALLLSLTFGAASAQDDLVRVAIVMPSSTTDLAWSQAIYTGLLEVQAELGGETAMEIAFTEGMFDVTAAAEALRDYAEDGYDLVMAHGTQYGSSLFELATDYPETSFAYGTAAETGENIFAYEAQAQEGGYVNGVMAGLMTESNVIGIVGPVPAGDGLLYINGFQQGVYASNPDAEILLAYTGSFGDTAAAAEIAQTQIAAGADVMSGSAQQVPGAIEAIEAAGGVWFGTQSDQSPGWPETVVSSQIYNWAPVIMDMLENRENGVLGGVAYNLTLSNEGLDFVFGDVALPEEVTAAAEAAVADIAAGEIVPLAALPEETFRVAIVLPSTINDLDWSQGIYDGLTTVQSQLGGEGNMAITFTEGMFDVTAAAEALRDYAEDGNNLVIAHGTQYTSTLFDLAPEYPDTLFAYGTSTNSDAGIFAYEPFAEQGGYVNGVVAALLTETGTVGIVGPIPAGDALSYNSGFYQGVKATNPDIDVLVSYTGSFGDTAGAAEAAQTQLAAGADILTGSAQQSVGAIEAVAGAGATWLGATVNSSETWPDTVAAAQVYNWSSMVSRLVESSLSGAYGGEAFTLTLDNGGLVYEIYSDLPEDVVAAAMEAAAAIEAGDIVVERAIEEVQ